MFILNDKIINTCDHISNLELKNSDNKINNILTKKDLKIGQLKHNPSSIKEWYNSIYSLEKYKCEKTLLLKDKFIYKVFDIYFNLSRSKDFNNLSMSKIFISKPEIKHFNNKIHITLYIFDKWIMRFYYMTGMIKTTEALLLLNNKQFIMFENKPFVFSILLLKHPKLDQKLIRFVDKLLMKTFNNDINSDKFLGILYTDFINFFDKMELYDLLGLERNISINEQKLLVDKYGLNNRFEIVNKDLFKMSHINKKVKRCLYLYLCIINYFFSYIGFPRMIDILRRILLCSSKEKRINNMKIILKELRKVYLERLGFNSLYLLIRLVNFFLMIRKLLRNIYVMKWYNKNIYYSRYKFNIKSILSVKNIINKLYNNKIEINLVKLKYLYLDGNIFATTVVRKLKNRNRRVLKVIRMALKLSKKPYINKFYTDLLNVNNLDTMLIKKNLSLSINNSIPSHKDLISKPISYRDRIIFFYLKHKVISGMKLQGTGRLTKRLTASRSISKSMGKGSLKNKASSCNGLSTVVLRGYVKSNMQYININSYNRIGTYGIKSWISSY
jgi:Mitochondrial ribosomal protein (VAR1)